MIAVSMTSFVPRVPLLERPAVQNELSPIGWDSNHFVSSPTNQSQLVESLKHTVGFLSQAYR